MKKRVFCIIIAILLMIFTASPVLAADTGDTNSSTDNSEINLENAISSLNKFGSFSGSSPQLALAMLQMELAQANKQQAMSSIKEIENEQAEKKKVAGFLTIARECREKAASTKSKSEMPSDMAQFLQSKKISYRHTGDDLFLTSNEWDTVIDALTEHLNGIGKSIQTQMVQLQDFMSQYNSYMQGANTAIAQSNQVLSGLARGQSMYGDSEVGFAVTGLLVGLVLGCLITIAVQKSRKKKDNA